MNNFSLSPLNNIAQLDHTSAQGVFLNSPESDNSITNLAQRINERKLPLKNLKISKEKLIELASFLTFVDCRQAFYGWENRDVEQFLNNCSQKVQTLLIDSPNLKALPPLPECEKLDCSGCQSLILLPSLPKCREIILVNCPNLERSYCGFSSDIILDCINSPIDIDDIHDADDIKFIALLLNHQRIFLNQLKLDFSELQSLAPHLTVLNWENAFENWPLNEVDDFLNLCPEVIFQPPTTKANIFIEQLKKLKISIPEFISNFLDKTDNLPPHERLLKFQDFLIRHDGNIEQNLTELINVIFLTIKIDLPDISLKHFQKTLTLFKNSLTDKEKVFLKRNLEILDEKFKNAIIASRLQLQKYCKFLDAAIAHNKLPKNVFKQLLKSTIIHINSLQNVFTKMDFDQLMDKIKFLEDSLTKSTPNSYLDSLRLKANSTLLKKGMTSNELNSRILEKEQIDRISEKLEKELSSIQVDFNKTKYSDIHLGEFLEDRILSGKSETLDSNEIEILEENFNSLCIAHTQGDRPNQEDMHLATIIPINFGKEVINVPIYGIFDGHGGQKGSKFLSEHLARKLKFELNNAFKSINRSNQKEIDAAIFNTLKTIFHKLTQEYLSLSYKEGGSTACIALVLDGKLWVANLGDTRAILNVNGLPIVLSRDCGLDTIEQKKSIEKRGGTIVECGNPPYYSELRVNPMPQYMGANNKIGLNMSRSACEFMYSLNTRTKVTCFPLNLLPPGVKTLCIACDGAFDVLSSNDVAKELYKKIQDSESLRFSASSMIEAAYNKGSYDNISTLLLDLSFPLECKPLLKKEEEKEEKN